MKLTNTQSPFKPRYSEVFRLLLALITTLPVAFVIAKGGMLIGVALIVLPVVFFYLYFLFTTPKMGLYSCVYAGFLVNGIVRYISGIPLGLSIDGLLIVTWLAILVHKSEKYDYKLLKNGLVIANCIWMLYNVFEIFNPEARSMVAWFYAMRGVALYPLLTAPLVFLLVRYPKDVERFMFIWFALSIFGTFNGAKQLIIGVDRFEQAWLDAGAATQHILFGKLRVFSFYSDAGQFGVSQGHCFVAAGVLALRRGISIQKKAFYGFAAVCGLYGMMVSGTRGAIAVPAIGFFSYFFMSKNFKIVGLGVICGFMVFYLLKYTSVGQGIYAINRMRTALDPNDASLQVRLENQRKLSNYLASRPFGGGVGSAGSWGERFSPGSFLAETPTDSWYVKIWAEEGIIGLLLHIAILLYIAAHSGYFIWHMPDSELRQQMMAIWSGMLGIYVASYGNGVLGQVPTGTLLNVGMGMMFMIPYFNKYIEDQEAAEAKALTEEK